MIMVDIQTWIDQNPALAPWVIGAIALVLSAVVFLITRFIIARGLVYLAKQTESEYDDIVVEQLRPFRIAWIAPLLLIYFAASLLPAGTELIQDITISSVVETPPRSPRPLLPPSETAFFSWETCDGLRY